MNALYLIRHSLTVANERRLYGGCTDIPLTDAGREIAVNRRGTLPECDIYISSGMRRADETLRLLTGRAPDLVLAGLREMDFGLFENMIPICIFGFLFFAMLPFANNCLDYLIRAGRRGTAAAPAPAHGPRGVPRRGDRQPDAGVVPLGKPAFLPVAARPLRGLQNCAVGGFARGF